MTSLLLSVALGADLTVCLAGCTHPTLALALGAADDDDTIRVEGIVDVAITTTIDKAIRLETAPGARLTLYGLTVDAQGPVTLVGTPQDPIRVRGIGNQRPITARSELHLSLAEVTRGNLTATPNEGGLVHATAFFTADNVTFDAGEANLRGGAIWADAMLEVTHSTVSRNQAENGGAIYLQGSAPSKIEHVVFDTNLADESGGDLYADGPASLTLRIASTVAHADGSGPEQGGGSVFAKNLGVLEVLDSNFEGSEADFQGGALRVADTPLVTVRGSVFTTSKASDGGGAIALARVDAATIEQSLFTFPDAPFGAAVKAVDPNGWVDLIFRNNLVFDARGSQAAVFVDLGVVDAEHVTFLEGEGPAFDGIDVIGAIASAMIEGPAVGGVGGVFDVRDSRTGPPAALRLALWNNQLPYGLPEYRPDPFTTPDPLSTFDDPGVLGGAGNPLLSPDEDQDAQPFALDCDDDEEDTYVGAVELLGDGRDQNCDGLADACYDDADGDGWGVLSTTQPVGYPTCEETGRISLGNDCDDDDPAVHPTAFDACDDGIDADCAGFGDERRVGVDADGDTHLAPVWTCDPAADPWADGDLADCNDGDPSIHPGASEVEADGVDSDCDGFELCWEDLDDDGFGASDVLVVGPLSCVGPLITATPADCDDTDASAFPGAEEVCGDGSDNDCNGAVDDGPTFVVYRDGDGDGFGDPATESQGCEVPPGWVTSGDDCDDRAGDIHPGAPEAPGGGDADCDGLATCFRDDDLDGSGGPSQVPTEDLACAEPGHAAVGDDCDDLDPLRFPGAEERCDGIDNDCDDVPDDGQPILGAYFADRDGDGFGAGSPVPLCALSEGWVEEGNDCDDTDPGVHPAAPEVAADDVDQDCDGLDLCFVDEDGDGAGTPRTRAAEDCDSAGASRTADDCRDDDATIFPGAVEAPLDGVDQDCDGRELCGVDGDGDGFGDSTARATLGDLACAGEGVANNVDDCDDQDADRFPGNPEVPGDGVDQDCSDFQGESWVGGGCEEGCSTQGSPSGPLGLLLVGLAGLRRRRGVTVAP